jgi:hypothetical protein
MTLLKMVELHGYDARQDVGRVPETPDVKTVVGMVPVPPANLDCWDYADGGRNVMRYSGVHSGLGRTEDGKWYICNFGKSDEGKTYFAALVTEEHAKERVLQCVPQDYEKFFGEPAPELQVRKP